jgi:hypothetical protein
MRNLFIIIITIQRLLFSHFLFRLSRPCGQHQRKTAPLTVFGFAILCILFFWGFPSLPNKKKKIDVPRFGRGFEDSTSVQKSCCYYYYY